ncbi:MAG: hypothetical protein EXR51_08170 [Dehalococcoidia bacterium]|nr:hypothetical protein [Dehalococcoidia bacterium]
MIGTTTGWKHARDNDDRVFRQDSGPRSAATGAAPGQTMGTFQPKYGPTRRDRFAPALTLIATQLFGAAVFWFLLPMMG